MNDQLRAFIVCVDFLDLLAVTLPYNRHHFKEVNVITSPADQPKIKEFLWDLPPLDGSLDQSFTIYPTDAFYRNGATFNKWLALEEGLDAIGREGWICLMDADILWPKELPNFEYRPGRLYTPLRRVLPDAEMRLLLQNNKFPPPETDWWQYPIHRNITEWAGYSQIFHSLDPVLGPPPWHQVTWTHAGGADSFFQQKWPLKHRHRPPFEALHLGDTGANWMGRVSDTLDGMSNPMASTRREMMTQMFANRRMRRGDFSQEMMKPKPNS